MDSSSSVSSSRRSYDVPKPETGLADWTSKIKALQRQVDADEEHEQKRLEEEIAAARQARLRRSHGMGTGSRVESLDMYSNKEQLAIPDSANDPSASDTPKSLSERQSDQETALRKLMGRNDVYNPDKIAAPATAVKSEGVSLAAFLGGHATGPRLNRHAPQQDAHDPTQFVQPNLNAPHPVFGRGGVAMPGMAIKKESKSPGPIVGSEISERYRPSSAIISKSTVTSAPKQDAEKGREMATEEKVDTHRRSFTGTLKSPSSAIAQRYTEKPEALSDRSASPNPEPLQRNRNSFSSTPKPISPLPTYMKKEETVARETNTFLPKPTGSSRSTTISPAVSKPAVSFIGTGTTPKSISTPPRNGADISISATKDTPLCRLMEANNVYNPDKVATESSRKSVAERAQTVSLAAFMGAPGKGIRLNRHAPQQDAHDPTQFVQSDISAPHPIFGKGGIAMPGMATRKSTSSQDVTPGTGISEPYRPAASIKPIWSPVAGSEKAEEWVNSPQKTGNRDRALSTPRTEAPLAFSSSMNSAGWISHGAARVQSPAQDTLSSTPIRDRTLSGPSHSQSAATKSQESLSHSSSRPSVTTPSLARPIRPEPKASSLSPKITGTVVPSPAFQKPLAQKDLTPSLSRLQGRGFVQNVVKASTRLETPSSPTPPSSDRSRPTSASGKKGSVLDRWHPNVHPSSPNKSPPAPHSNAMRRSATQDPTTKPHIHSFHVSGSSSFTGGGIHTLKSTSLPSFARPESSTVSEPIHIEDPYQRSRTPGLGSATTMVLIKPNKSSSDLTQLGHVDELGLKHDYGRGARNDQTQISHPAGIPPSSKKPLIHPTKDRARKPKKHNDAHDLASSSSIHLGSPVSDRPLTSAEQQVIHSADHPAVVTSEIFSIPSGTAMANSSSSTGSFFSDWKAEDVHLGSDHRGQLNVESPVIMEAAFPPPIMPKSPVEVLPLSRTPEPLSVAAVSGPPSKLSDAPSSPVKERASMAPSPGKHVRRIPSTGSRPTVMDVAQTLLDFSMQDKHSESTTCITPSVQKHPVPSEPTSKPRNALSQIQAEKRKSSYEKYAAIILPPLKEEATPTPSPAGTLARNASHQTELSTSQPQKNLTLEPKANIVASEVNGKDCEETDEYKRLLDRIDVASILRSRPQPPVQPADIQTVSVEVLAITGTTATPLSQHLAVFYDSEILVIIHRIKSKSSGLVSTSVWCWLGKQTRLGDREEKKLYELAKRYGTTAKIVHQLAEPYQLIQILGGRLAIRQGTRIHWTAENTTMHLVRALNGVILIDEHELNIKNLCSAFSYCVTILGSVYVWHGCGSTAGERKSALQYAKTLSKDSASPIELVEGENDADEMFWMILGEDEFAKADYWRWRKSFSDINPFTWKITVDKSDNPVAPVQFISMEQHIHESVYVIDCIWELFVLVGKEARGDRQTIRFALDVAKKMSTETASAKPYAPTVHVLIFPSQLPLDLRLGIRDLDEAWLNNGEIPDHMNLLPSSEAFDHLDTHSWEHVTLEQHDMLPLGVGATDNIFCDSK